MGTFTYRNYDVSTANHRDYRRDSLMRTARVPVRVRARTRVSFRLRLLAQYWISRCNYRLRSPLVNPLSDKVQPRTGVGDRIKVD